MDPIPAVWLQRLKKQKEVIRLNGAKMWITNGTIADVAVVWAKLDGVVKGFLVEKGFEGFTAPEMKGKHSLKASVTSELIFDNVFMPEKNILPGTAGLKNALMCLNQARYGIAWGVVGSMMACYDAALIMQSKGAVQQTDCSLPDDTGETCLHAY